MLVLVMGNTDSHLDRLSDYLGDMTDMPARPCLD